MNPSFLLSAPSPVQPGSGFELLGALLNVIKTPVSYCDAEFRYGYVNDALAARIGKPANTIIGRTVSEIHGEHVFSVFKPLLARVLEGEQVSYEGEINRHAADTAWWLIDYYPNRDANGNVIGYFTLSRDHSEIKRLQQEVSERDAQLRQLAEAIKLPIACWGSDSCLLYCNSPYEMWIDCPQDQLLGRSLKDILGATAWTLARASFERAFLGEASSYERQVKQRDGSLRWHRIQVFPGAIGAETTTRVFTIAFDIEDDIRMRQQLAASEARLRSVLDTINQPIIRLDRGRIVTYCNKAFAAYTRRSAGDIVGQTLGGLFGESASARVDDHYSRALRGETVQFEQQAGLGDTRHWLRIQIVPDRDAAGNVRGVYATAYDVDAEIRANLSLQESQKRLDRFADSIPFPLTYLDRDACYRFANRAFLERHRLSLESVVGCHPAAARGQKIWDEYRPYFERALAGEEVVYERTVALANGELRWTRTTYSPDRSASGDITGVYTASSDIHDIKSAQLELARVNGQLQAHLNQSPVAVVEYDANWNIAQWSKRAEEMLGSTKDEMLSRSAESGRVHPDDRLEVAEIMRKIRAAEVDTIVNTHRYQHAAGHYVWIQWYTSVAKDAHGKLHSVLSLGVDTTARIDAERRLQRFADRIPNPVAYVGPDSRYQFINLAFEQWTGITPAQMLGKTVVEVRGETLGGLFQGHIDRALCGEETYLERRTQLPDGEWRWTKTIFAPDRDESDKIVGCYKVSFDIHQAKLAEQALMQAANRDSLTHALSRSAFFKELEYRLASEAASVVALFFIDLDGFKNINDSLGHAEGDRLLVDVVANVRLVLEGDDVVARLGGDEFIVLTDCTSRDQAMQRATKILAAVEQSSPQRAPNLTISASVGVAIASECDATSGGDALIREADAAMYVAKRAGGRQIRFSDSFDRSSRATS